MPIDTIPTLPHKPKKQYTPSRADVLRVMEVATRSEKVFLNCFLQTGARRTEIFGLRWSDIDFQRRTVTLETHKTRNGSSRRDILPMSDELYEDLVWWRDWEGRQFTNRTHVFICDRKGTGYGRPFTTRHKFMRGICRRAGVRYFGFHALRRHVASYLADSGNVSIKAIQGLLRHQSLQVTERYVQRISSDLRDTVSILTTHGD